MSTYEQGVQDERDRIVAFLDKMKQQWNDEATLINMLEPGEKYMGMSAPAAARYAAGSAIAAMIWSDEIRTARYLEHLQ